MRRQVVIIAAIVSLLSLAAPARADLMISLGAPSQIITTGGVGSLDVTVTADSATDLNIYEVVFTIERLSGAGDLQFVDPQSLSYRTSGNNYIFGDAHNDDVSVVRAFNGTSNQQYHVIDSFLDPNFGDVTLTSGSGPYLLSRLQLTADPTTGLQPTDGSTFRVSVNTASYDSANTGGGPFLFTINDSSVVTIRGMNVVPEPSSLVSALICLGIGLVGREWSRRRSSGKVVPPSK